jgi:ABC-type phosphate transport system substrate-binding protein
MNRKSKIFVVNSALVATVVLFCAVGCNYDENGKTKEPEIQTTNVETFLASGSTFIAPLITRWGADYEKSHPVHVNYHSIGSGGGIDNLHKGVGAFAASDAPLSDDQLQGLPPIVQIPVTAGPVCIIYNIPGLNSPLRLSGSTLAGIYSGDIISWQDSAIARDNPGVKLPRAAIIVVHRSDGSGTTNIFTNYLSKVSPSWSKKLGKGLAVEWPAGIGGDGSSAVLAAVKHNPGTIGYLELSYAKAENLSDYATQEESEERYFKNRMGGLGQYYVGPLAELGVCSKAPSGPWIRYTEQFGEVLAHAIETALPSEAFWAAVERDVITIKDLIALREFSPHLLAINSEEQNLLLDMFFVRPGYSDRLGDENGAQRRDSKAQGEGSPHRSEAEAAKGRSAQAQRGRLGIPLAPRDRGRAP